MEEYIANIRGGSNTTHQYEVRLRRRDGVYRWFLVRTIALPTAPGAPRRWLSSSTDIDDLKQTQGALAKAAAALDHLAHHDALTKLPNRVRLSEDLDRALSRAHRSNLGVIVMYIDVDNFKSINDTLGHAAGDDVLAQAGTRIAEVLRSGDLACRIGGDEFVLVCMTSEGANHAAHIAQRLLASLAKPMHVQGTVVSIGASIGISLHPRDGHDVAGLLRKADSAMYAAKEAGRNCYRVFGEKTHSPTMEALEFEADLREAIANRELVVAYQPIVRLDTNRIVGAEALVRWQHPRRGLLLPSEFIKIAEKTDLIAQLSYVVVDAACELLNRIVADEHEEFFISVNASARQFEVAGLADGIANALKLRGVSPARIEVEITESLMMSTVPTVIESFNAIRELGVKLSIDDFGTGYCSLGYLRKYPLNTIKIDQSFVEHIADSVTDQAIARAIISLAHTMQMSVIAEGVESEEQLARLRSLGCDAVQGNYISRPLSSDDFERFVRRHEVVHRDRRRRPLYIVDDFTPGQPLAKPETLAKPESISKRREPL
jgi:diguanylate cyclase (GGDEF)-like protein